MSDGGFAVVPRWLFTSGVSASALAVYAVLSLYAGPGGECWPSHATIAEKAGASRSTVKRALVELEQVGAVTWGQRARDDGGRSSNCYILQAFQPREEVPDVSCEDSTRVNMDYPQSNMSYPLGQYELPPRSYRATNNNHLTSSIEERERSEPTGGITLSPRHVSLAEERGLNASLEATKFDSWRKANGRHFADVGAAFTKWLLDARPASPRESIVPEEVRQRERAEEHRRFLEEQRRIEQLRNDPVEQAGIAEAKKRLERIVKRGAV